MTPPSGVNPEFIAEAQEIVDALNRDLIAAENEAKQGEVSPERINNLFRSAHSLKGISGMFGLEAISNLAHSMENVLDGMRLGRVSIDSDALDVLFGCVEQFSWLVGAAAEGRETSIQDVEAFMQQLREVSEGTRGSGQKEPLELVELGDDVLNVLTEYEEHRLRENLRKGRNLFMLRTSFDLTNFDMGLAVLDDAVKNVGEIITKLPSSKEAEPGSISFDIIVGSDSSTDVLTGVVNDERVEVVPIQQKALVRPQETPESGGHAEPTTAAGREEASADAETTSGEAALLPATGPVETQTEAPADASPYVASPPESAVAQQSGTSHELTEVSELGETEPSQESARGGADTTSVKSVSQTVRVDIRRLDRLMNLVGELALTKAAFQQISDVMKRDQGFTGVAVDLHKESRNFERRLQELQSGIMEVRMVPLANLFERMVRVGRKIGRELGRQVRMEVTGEHTELDKLIVEDLADPLMHLIRNAIDHGIEPPEDREQKGKDTEGVVKLAAAAQGNHVLVEVSDDGRGIDPDKTVQSAIEKGLVTREQAREMSRREIYSLLFMPGFSTRKEVSEYSGRGVGMDVVKTNITELSGVIDVDSTPGQGMTVTVTLPITLAIIPALIVSVVDRTFAIPLNNVMETLAIDKSMIKTIERREVISVRGSTVPLVDLRELFEIGDGSPRPDLIYGVVAGVGQNRMALVVDDLVGQQDIVIKSLGRRLRHARGIAGATELGNQQTILVIDMVELLNEMSLAGRAAMELQ